MARQTITTNREVAEACEHVLNSRVLSFKEARNMSLVGVTHYDGYSNVVIEPTDPNEPLDLNHFFWLGLYAESHLNRNKK